MAAVVSDADMKQLAEELHKPVRKHFATRKVPQQEPGDVFGADLADMSYVTDENDGYKYMLAVIDLGSRYAWASPLKNKDAKTVANEWANVLADAKKLGLPAPKRLWVDQGGEFAAIGPPARDPKDRSRAPPGVDQKALRTKGPRSEGSFRYHTFGVSKSAFAERLIRTLKTALLKRMTAANTLKWLDLLPIVVDEYNSKRHSMIGMSPKEAIERKLAGVEFAHQPFRPKTAEAAFKVGDVVRISRSKGVYEHGYTPSWSRELFTVAKVDNRVPPLYKIKDCAGEVVEGAFYTEELQKVHDSIKGLSIIETVLKRDKRRKKILVKWLGYPDKFNSWIPEAHAVDVVQR